MEVLTFDDTTFGAQQCELNLARLYPESPERRDFQSRYEDFVRTDEFTQQLFSISGDTLQYTTEVFASDRIDDRPPLLLLLGNPASHSVVSGLCFAFEKSGSEHRFWKVLSEVGVLNFQDQTSIAARWEALRNLQYESPFRVTIAVFYSLPTPASHAWSGVSGIRKLLGARAFKAITSAEENRIQNLVSRFLYPAGGILAFQKDAYNGVRSPDSPPYSQASVYQGLLVRKYKLDENIRLAGSPPTRRMYSDRTRHVLEQHKNWLCGRP